MGTKISSISGAHRKRKWKEEEDEEEEQKEEENNDIDTSSDEADDDITEKNESTDATTSSQENKEEVMEEQRCVEKKEEDEKKTSDEEKIHSKKLSQPAVFVPVDRSPEIQVCAWLLYLHLLTVTESIYISTICPIRDVGGSNQAACAVRGAGHHGGGPRKSLHRHMWRDGKWKDHPSASVSLRSWLRYVSYPHL